MPEETRHAIDEWADQIAALEPDARDGIVAFAKRLAADRRLRKSDRDFADAQAKALIRAIRRADTRKTELRGKRRKS